VKLTSAGCGIFMDELQIYKFKFVIIGENAVGKTSLARAFVSRQFQLDYRPTIGTNVFVHKFTLRPNLEVSVSLFDIAGQEKWAMMRNVYYKGAQAAFLVGDLTRQRSFEDLTKFWYPDFSTFCAGSPVIILANKLDLESKTDTNVIENVAKEVNAVDIVYTSAKTGENCDEALRKLVEICLEQT